VDIYRSEKRADPPALHRIVRDLVVSFKDGMTEEVFIERLCMVYVGRVNRAMDTYDAPEEWREDLRAWCWSELTETVRRYGRDGLDPRRPANLFSMVVDNEVRHRLVSRVLKHEGGESLRETSGVDVWGPWDAAEDLALWMRTRRRWVRRMLSERHRFRVEGRTRKAAEFTLRYRVGFGDFPPTWLVEHHAPDVDGQWVIDYVKVRWRVACARMAARGVLVEEGRWREQVALRQACALGVRPGELAALGGED